MSNKLKYQPPREITVYECRYCRCRLNSLEEHDNHFNEQHKKTGLPFCISMTLPPTDIDDESIPM
jgi:hypothetical protein